MQQAYDTAHPSPASPAVKVLRGLMYLGGYVAAAGLLLAFGRRGDPIWPDGRLLLIAGGIPFLAYGAWAYTTRTKVPGSTIPLRWEAVGAMLFGLGLVGGGIDHLDPEGPWLLLAAPIGAAALWWAWYMGEQEAEVAGKQQAALAVVGLAALVIAATEFI